MTRTAMALSVALAMAAAYRDAAPIVWHQPSQIGDRVAQGPPVDPDNQGGTQKNPTANAPASSSSSSSAGPKDSDQGKFKSIFDGGKDHEKFMKAGPWPPSSVPPAPKNKN